MAKDFNQAIVMGNLTRDPELKTIPSGQAVASFSVATNRSWQDASGERRDSVEYHDIVAWGKLGELAAQYLGRGRKVLVVGRLQTRQWDAPDGTKRQKTEIVATDINFIDRPGDGGSAPQASEDHAPEGESSIDKKKSAKTAKSDEVAIEDLPGEVNLDDIPF